MPNIVELIESGANINAKALVESKLYQAAAVALDQKYRKTIAETFCLSEKMLHHKKKSVTKDPNPFRGHKPVVASPTGLMIKTAKQYGFRHKSSGVDVGGKWHEFKHPAGNRITVHSAKGGPYFSHSTNNGKKHLGTGTTHKEMKAHLSGVFPSYAPKRKKLRKESLQNEFGESLIEHVQMLKEASIAKPIYTVHTQQHIPADLHFAKVTNTDHTKHPFHSHVTAHGYQHAETNGDENIARHKYVNPKNGHGIQLTSHGNTHSWGAIGKERHQHVDHYLTKMNECDHSPEGLGDDLGVERNGGSGYSHDEIDEKYVGFKKLEKKLSHEKGVTDPDALAASIGRKKYGSKGFSTHKHGG